MENNLKVSIIIPVFNMADSVNILVESIVNYGLHEKCSEVIVFDDGSTDHIEQIMKKYAHLKGIKYIKSQKNLGRYNARLEAVQKSVGEFIFFLDARTKIFKDIMNELISTCHSPVVQGVIQIPHDESIYSLYWQRSHQKLFDKNFTEKKGFWLNKTNFEEYTCGLGIFFVKKDIFLTACQSFSTPPLSDDRDLIKKICDALDIWVNNDLVVEWRPRQNLKSFLFRIWERGQTFVDYHFYEIRSPFRKFIFLGIILVLINLIALLFNPAWTWMLMFFQLVLIGMTVIFFTKKWTEFVKLFPLHILVVLIFGSGVIMGLVRIVKKEFINAR